jgi:hypothetical protein
MKHEQARFRFAGAIVAVKIQRHELVDRGRGYRLSYAAGLE